MHRGPGGPRRVCILPTPAIVFANDCIHKPPLQSCIWKLPFPTQSLHFEPPFLLLWTDGSSSSDLSF